MSLHSLALWHQFTELEKRLRCENITIRTQPVVVSGEPAMSLSWKRKAKPQQKCCFWCKSVHRVNRAWVSVITGPEYDLNRTFHYRVCTFFMPYRSYRLYLHPRYMEIWLIGAPKLTKLVTCLGCALAWKGFGPPAPCIEGAVIEKMIAGWW